MLTNIQLEEFAKKLADNWSQLVESKRADKLKYLSSDKYSALACLGDAVADFVLKILRLQLGKVDSWKQISNDLYLTSSLESIPNYNISNLTLRYP